MARDAADSGVRWKFRALWLVLLVAGMTIGGAAVGLLVHGPLGALVGVIPGAVASVIAGFVPGLFEQCQDAEGTGIVCPEGLGNDRRAPAIGRSGTQPDGTAATGARRRGLYRAVG